MTDFDDATTRIRAFIAERALTMECAFVPHSAAKRTRQDWTADKADPWKGLTWEVTIKRAGVEVLKTPYSVGIAYCPAYELPKRSAYDGAFRQACLDWEIEHGYQAHATANGIGFAVRKARDSVPLEPDFEGVLASLAMDASALDEPIFEEWADSLGYDRDSRKAEKVYRACLEIGLKLRNALGEDGLSALREACQDY